MKPITVTSTYFYFNKKAINNLTIFFIKENPHLLLLLYIYLTKCIAIYYLFTIIIKI